MNEIGAKMQLDYQLKRLISAHDSPAYVVASDKFTQNS